MSSQNFVRGGIRIALIRLLALLIGALGLAMGLGRVQLGLLGGSSYYFIAGILLCISAVLLWRKPRAGAQVYALVLVTTLLWTLMESGFDPWSFVPRMSLLMLLGNGVLFASEA
jgi:quinoprotein glucose dehydrogenase